MSMLPAFLAEVLGTAFAYEAWMLLLFVFTLTIKRHLWRVIKRPMSD